MNYFIFDNDLLFTSQQSPLWLNFPLFSGLFPVVCVCFQLIFFIINQWINGLSYACICLVLHVINERLRLTGCICVAVPPRQILFFSPTETRAVTPGPRLWSCRVGFQPRSGRQRASNSLCNKLHVIYLTSLCVVFNVTLNDCSAANQIAL